MTEAEARRDALRARLLADSRITNKTWTAYMLATVRHETGGTYAPIEEWGSDEYLVRRYWNNERVRKALGNICQEDAVKYKGRSYVQITGRANYTKFASLLGCPLVDIPEKALDPDISYEIMVRGMLGGLFTGKKLQDYICEGCTDLFNARKVINWTDKANLISQYAELELEALNGGSLA